MFLDSKKAPVLISIDHLTLTSIGMVYTSLSYFAGLRMFIGTVHVPAPIHVIITPA